MTASTTVFIPVDEPTRTLVSTTGLGRTLFVEAGAGSGKTTQLVQRIVSLVVTAGVPLGEIAAITFTEAAAAELRSRIRVAFERQAVEATDERIRDRCRAALAAADQAAISTLHGFAYRLLSEFAPAAGLPPRIGVLDEVSSRLEQERRWERLVDELYGDPANEELLLRARRLKIALEPGYRGQTTLQGVAIQLDQNWDRVIGLAGSAPRPLAPLDVSEFRAAVAAVHELPAQCSDPGDRLYGHIVNDLLPEMDAIASIADPHVLLGALVGVSSGTPYWGPGNGGVGKVWQDKKAAVATIRTVTETATRCVAMASDEVLRALLLLTSREVVTAAQQRRRRGGLEFHDLLVLARELLRGNAEVRSVLHERYRHLLLDEFQDTDPIQIELAVLIASGVGAGAIGSWSELAVPPGRLFFVGDPKQSIYRFRRADIGLFLAARSRFGPDDTHERLVTNFRTVAPILDWVNAYFGDVMAIEDEGKQAAYQALVAARAADSGADHRPVLLGGPHDDARLLAGALREREAASVADAVSRIVERPQDWPVHDELIGAWRPARLSDITILVPTRTSLPYLRDALERAGISYRLATGTLVYDTQEIRDLLAVLTVIDDPTDQLSLVAALRSPLFACSDVDLFTFHRDGGRWNLRVEPPDTVATDHPVRVALADLRELWLQRWWLTPSQLISAIYERRRAMLLAFGDRRPREVWRRLRFFLDQARQFEEAQAGGGLRAFLEWAGLQGADGARVHEPLLPETDDDALRIMTIHGAKGLEFPITILSGLTTQPGNAPRGASVLWNEDGSPEVKLAGAVATAAHQPRADLELEMDQHEKLRLLYVAATRARDHLIVSCHYSPKGKGTETYAALIARFFADHPELSRRLPLLRTAPAPAEPAVVPAPPQPSMPDRDAWIAERRELIARSSAPGVMSATGLARSAAAAAVGVPEPDELDRADADADAVSDDEAVVPVRRRGRTGSAIGTAVHATLQMLDFTARRPLADEQVRQACELEAIPDKVPTVAAMVRAALASPAVQLAAAHRHHKELYLAAPVGDRMIEGYVDLLIETPDGLVVVDYKTDAVNSAADVDAKVAVYELQAAAYAVALERVTGQPVVDCRFVFCKPGGAIERHVADLPAAKRRVLAVCEAAPP